MEFTDYIKPLILRKNLKRIMMIKLILLNLSFLIISLFAFTSCNQNQNGEPEDTPTSGRINITVDETFKPIIDSEIAVFESLYKYASINVSYKPEEKAFEDLMDDSARIIIVTRELTTAEKKHFEDLKLFPRMTKIAYDAVALVTNNANPDSLFTDDQVKKIVTGEISKWNQINPKSQNIPIQLVFDNKNSGTLRYLKEYAGNKNLSKNSFAEDSSNAVIDYVSKNKNAIGIIGVTWVSDRNDSTLLSFINKVRVDEISPPDSSEGRGDYYKPYQAYIATKYYPLWRTVYIISREARAGLGTGFASFIAGDKGQKIILKTGLVPASMPVRLVELRNQNFHVTK
jgi:phosphate transport system substrate-binding protein